MFNTLYGLKIYVDDALMTEYVDDWSNVRSPSRAKRRIKRGFKQNVRRISKPKDEILRFGDKLIVHSQMLKKIQLQTNKDKLYA